MKKIFTLIADNDFATFTASWIVTYFTFYVWSDVQISDIGDYTILFLVVGWPFAMLAVPFVTIIAILGSR